MLCCIIQSRHYSTPVKILWVILNRLVEKVSYTNLISLAEESSTSHTHKVVSLPIQSKLHFALLCLNSLQGWGWGQCKTFKHSYKCIAVPGGNVLWKCYRDLVLPIIAYSRSTSSLVHTHDKDKNISEIISTMDWIRCIVPFQSHGWCSELHYGN